MLNKIHIPALGRALLYAALVSTSHAQSWPEVFDPMVVKTLNFELDPEIWEDIKRDTNFYDKELNIRVPVLMWADGEEPITVQMRRKSDPALPSEEDPQKVSLKIDINEYVQGQRWHDLTKLSLENGNGGNGPVREGLSMNLHRLAAEAGFGFGAGAPGHASWIRVVVNGEYIGLYASPEQRDKQFLRNRGLYKPGSVWLYEVNGGTMLDETVSLTDSPTFQALCYQPFKERNPCPQPDLETELPKWVDMDSMLTLAAIEAYCGNIDGLIFKGGKNSFAVDFLPSAQYTRWYLPWDLDNGMTNITFNIYGSDGKGNKASSYVTHIIGHPWFGQQYKHIMRDLIDGPLSPAVLNAFITELEAALSPALAEDPNNMMGGVNAASVASHFQTLRDWVIARDANVRTQLGAMALPPVFSQSGGAITPGFSLTLGHGNADGTIYYTTDGSDPRAIGGAVAGIPYSGPITLDGTRHIMARVLNGTEWSALREATFTVPGHAADLRITEIMYRPLKVEEDGVNELEFLELKNTGPTPIDLSGLYFSNGIEYVFPKGAILEPGGFLVIAENEGHFFQRYGFNPFQVYRRKLSNDGERLRIRDALGHVVFSVTYGIGSPWPVLANGHGFSLVPKDPDTNPDPDDPANWRASATVGGSPGADDPAPVVLPILVTEALAHTDLPLRDAIEVFNPNEVPVDITGWYLSDKLTNPMRWQIPPTVIEPGEYLAFYESDEEGNVHPEHFGNAFALSASGEEAYIFSADADGNLTGFSHGFAFGASENGVSFGRYITSIGEEHFPPQKQLTLGAPNAGPLVGPVVITELMYNPSGTNDEFVELMNISPDPVPLFDPDHPVNTWRIGGIAYEFPQGITLAAGEVILVVPVEPAAFRDRYDIPAEIRILGPYSGNLSNSGERIRLRKPDSPNFTGGVWEVPYIDVDRVTYADRNPWPREPDGDGPSLERISPLAYADDPVNWRASAMNGGTPGVVEVPVPGGTYQAWQVEYLLEGPDALPLADPDGDGVENLLEYAFGMNPSVSSSVGLPVSRMVRDGDDDYLAITYHRRIGATDISYLVEFAGDPGSWPGEAGIEVDTAPGGHDLTEKVTVRDSVPITNASHRFGRVRVSMD